MNANTIARNAGLLYLLLIPLGIFGIIYVPTNLIIADDMAQTAKNILDNELLFRLSILSAMLVQIVNIFVALLLYKLLKDVNKNMAVLMVIFILLALPIVFVNELNFIAILIVLKSSDLSNSLIPLFLDLHQGGVFIAQLFWGLWLFPMGYLVFKSGFIPKIIGILLIIGCFGYLIDSIIYILLPDFDFTFSEFTFIGELAIALWLFIQGLRKKISILSE